MRPAAFPVVRPPEPSPSDRLQMLARAVERLNIGGRLDPEDIALTKQAIVQALRRIAAELRS